MSICAGPDKTVEHVCNIGTDLLLYYALGNVIAAVLMLAAFGVFWWAFVRNRK